MLHEQFVGSIAEFTQVTFPEPTLECIEYSKEDRRCSAWPDRRVGDPRAVCQKPPVQLSKIFLKDLSNLGPADIPEAIQSPAEKTLQLYELSDLRMAEILSYVMKYSGPREAVCEWFVDNLDMIKQSLVPEAYPRVLQEEEDGALEYVSMVIAVVAGILVSWAAFVINRRREERVIRYAQVEILQLILAGCLLVTAGAALYAAPPSDGVCLAGPWLTHFGYTLSLAPQIVKVAAINRLISAANRYQRTKINSKSLYVAVAGFCSVSVVYLVCWSSFDQPRKVPEYTNTNEQTQDGETIVEISYRCSSESKFWEYVPILWNGLLLSCAVVLVFQSRKLRNPFNETQYLGTLIVSEILLFCVWVLGSHLLYTNDVFCWFWGTIQYANFAFLIIRGATFFMDPVVDPNVVSQVRSIIMSFDMITSIAIYFLPMIFARRRQQRPGFRTSGSFDLDDTMNSTSFHVGARNRVLRFLTSVSRVTFDEGDNSQHAVDGHKPETVEEDLEDAEEFRSDIELSCEESCDATKDDDTMPTQELNEKEKIRDLEAKIASLTEEVNTLRKRAPHAMIQRISSSEKKSSEETTKA
jgi:7 transmembrane sweet-taste receptor of 3 GCPR